MSLEKMTCGVNYTTNLIASNVNGLIDAQVKAKPTSTAIYSPFGNSITAAGNGFWSWFSQSSKGGFVFRRNLGVGGNTTQDMLDRIETIPDGTNFVTVMEATNDASQDVSPVTHAQNMKQILETLIGKGITPVLILAPPLNNTVDTAAVNEMNLYDYITARSMGVMCFDIWSEFSDGLGFWVSGSDSDGTHPTPETQKIAGLSLYSKYVNNEFALPLSYNNNAGGFVNGLFMIDSNSDGIPDSWGSGGATGYTLSKTSLGVGNTWSFNCTASLCNVWQTVSLELGKKYLYACKVSSENVSGSGKFEIYVQKPSGGRIYLMQDGFEDMTNSTMMMEFEAEETGGYKFYFVSSGSGYEMNVSIAQMTLIDIESYTL